MPYKNREQKRQYDREWSRGRGVAKRAKWLQENGPCKHCQSWERLEVDHIDASTKVDHRVWTWSEERRMSELAKCQVLCKKCHTSKGMLSGEIPPAQHGNQRMYDVYGCRCEPCRTWKRGIRLRQRRAQASLQYFTK